MTRRALAYVSAKCALAGLPDGCKNNKHVLKQAHHTQTRAQSRMHARTHLDSVAHRQLEEVLVFDRQTHASEVVEELGPRHAAVHVAACVLTSHGGRELERSKLSFSLPTLSLSRTLVEGCEHLVGGLLGPAVHHARQRLEVKRLHQRLHLDTTQGDEDVRAGVTHTHHRRTRTDTCNGP